jgi:HD-GYP domain-containing protein (c-di-GMP phosphodiesterase class II)
MVFAVVDVFNALNSRRTYKKPFKDIQDVGIST